MRQRLEPEQPLFVSIANLDHDFASKGIAEYGRHHESRVAAIVPPAPTRRGTSARAAMFDATITNM